MKRLALATLAGLLVLILTATNCPACPMCNIHNYLYESVATSKNIFVAKVVKAAGERKAEAEVIRVLRGGHKPGGKVEVELWKPAENIGKTYVFSDPASMGPDFPSLPIFYEEEVQFLIALSDSQGYRGMRPRKVHGEAKPPPPKTQNVAEALRQACYYSNAGRHFGLAYIEKLKMHPAAEIIRALDALDKTPEVHRPHHMRCLIHALLLRRTQQGEKWVLDVIRKAVAAPPRKMDYEKVDYWTPYEAERLKALVGCSDPNWQVIPFCNMEFNRARLPGLRDKQIKILLDTYPKMGLAAMADATYALCATKLATAEKLEALLKDATNRDGMVLGLYWTEMRRAYWAMGGPKVTVLQPLLDKATDPALRKIIQERIQSAKDNSR